jgi:hypothetical protein
VELGLGPPDADTQAHSPVAEQVHLCGLLGDQGRLALWQDQEVGDELDAARQAGEIAEHEGLMEVF